LTRISRLLGSWVRNPFVKLNHSLLTLFVGLYISTLPQISFEDSLMITIQGKVLPIHTITVSKVSEFVLEIDVEKAWKEMELESRWSNEVEVKIYINPGK
jgi:hypothetical protein